MLLGLNFVATERLLGLSVGYVLAQHRIILAKLQLVRGIHGVLARVIVAMTAFVAHQSNYLTLVAFFCHNVMILSEY